MDREGIGIGVKFTKSNITEWLNNHGIPFNKSSKRDALILLYEQTVSQLDSGNGIIDNNMNGNIDSKTNEDDEYDKEIKTIVKCSLRKALNLDEGQYAIFLSQVNAMVNVTSRALRRASLAMNFHLIHLKSRDDVIPDLYDQNDTFWKNWLKIGILGTFPDEQSKISYPHVQSLIGKVLQSDNSDYLPEWPMHYDQVINYAGHTFRTSVTSNAWVPLFNRLARVTKHVMRLQLRVESSIKPFEVMNVIRSDNIPSSSDKFNAWPEPLRDYILDVRFRLGATAGVWLYDDYGSPKNKNISFQKLFDFNWFMQKTLEALNQRHLRLCPIFSVQRAHVRLDLKTLSMMLPNCFIPPQKPRARKRKDCTSGEWKAYKAACEAADARIKEAKALDPFERIRESNIIHRNDKKGKKDVKLTMNNLKELLKEHGIAFKAKDNRDTLSSLYETFAQQQASGSDLNIDTDGSAPPTEPQGINHVGKGHTNPDDYMIPNRPPIMKQKQCTDVEWKAYKATEKLYLDNIKFIKESAEYTIQLSKYNAFMELKRNAIKSCFDFSKLPTKKDWAFDCTLTTDGVAVSIDYSRKIRVKRANHKKKATIKKTEIKNNPDYDRHMHTQLQYKDTDTIVLGLDPGRSNIAVVTYQLDEATDSRELENVSSAKMKPIKNRKKKAKKNKNTYKQTNMESKRKKEAKYIKTWKLSRGHYYSASGINRHRRKQRIRFETLEQRWSALGADDSCLHSTDKEKILLYLTKYAALEEEWWCHALQPIESASKFIVYVGKRRAIDSFFSDIKQYMAKHHPKTVCKVAYGSAYSTMKSTGPGEVAAPVGEAYRACQRIFTKEHVHVTDEHRSTMVSWESGLKKEIAYKVLYEHTDNLTKVKSVREKLCHAIADKYNRYIPEIAPDHVDLVDEYIRRIKYKGKDRRGGNPTPNCAQDDENDLKNEQNEDIEDKTDAGNTNAADICPRKQRYPDIRGLRFCPEDRKFRDRDVQASLTIARLLCMELKGEGRPEPFCRGFDLKPPEPTSSVSITCVA